MRKVHFLPVPNSIADFGVNFPFVFEMFPHCPHLVIPIELTEGYLLYSVIILPPTHTHSHTLHPIQQTVR